MAIGNEDWLALVQEEIIEPARPICDPHHHLWDHPNSRYLLDELLADVDGGHNVVSTVFVECMSMYRTDGDEKFKPVGETEFVNGVAAMSASGQYGNTRACAGIVSFADLTLGSAVGEVLDAHQAAGFVPSRARFGLFLRRTPIVRESAAAERDLGQYFGTIETLSGFVPLTVRQAGGYNASS